MMLAVAGWGHTVGKKEIAMEATMKKPNLLFVKKEDVKKVIPI